MKQINQNVLARKVNRETKKFFGDDVMESRFEQRYKSSVFLNPDEVKIRSQKYGYEIKELLR